jgi:site-specific DNA-cytosine methylase
MADIFDQVGTPAPAGDVFDQVPSTPVSAAGRGGTGDVFDQAAAQSSPAGGDVFDQATSTDTLDKAANQNSILSRLKATVEGPGTFGGTHIEGDTWNNLIHSPINYAREVFPHATELENTPFVKLDNAMTPEQQKAHPIVTGASQFASDLTSPQNVGIAAVAGGALKTAPIADALTNSLSKAAVKAIPSLVSAGFGASMIKSAYDTVPEIKDALDRGDSSEAQRLITHAVLSGALGAYAGFHGAAGLHDVGSEALSEPGKVGAATQHEDYAKSIHQFQGENQITAAAAEQFKNEAEKAVPDEQRREALTNYREAAGDKALLALREQATREQAATGKGRIANTTTPLAPATNQGPDIPFGQPSAAQIANEQLAENAAKKPATPEQQKQFAERAKTLAEGYKIAQKLTPDEIAVEQKGAQLLADRKAELQNVGLLPQGQVQPNYVHHAWEDLPAEEDTKAQINSPRDFSPSSGNKDFLNRRVMDTYHAGEAAGFNPENKDLATLDADYLRDSGNVLAQKHLVNSLEQGTTNNGAPLVVKGGFMAQNGTIIPQFPQDVRLGDNTVKNMTATGKLSKRRQLPGSPSGGYTRITRMNSEDADRYRALGNSMAVPVMRWIGERISVVERCREALRDVLHERDAA